MRQLYSDGSSRGVDCAPGNAKYGCTAFCDNYPDRCPQGVPARPYPYSSAYPDISIEKDYLLDVVGQETSPDTFLLPALQAQAIASRSFIWYFINNPPPGGFNNSTQFQAFIPYKFETFGNDPDNPAQPCLSRNLTGAQWLLCAAVAGTPSYYLSWDDPSNPYFLPARANFIADILARTTSAGDKDYLIGVDDPISSDNATCSAFDVGNTYGMSQDGAGRWARGDQCYDPDQSLPWSVRWTRMEQILYHYFTDVHLRDGNRQVVASLSPPNRWNPLQLTGILANDTPSLLRTIDYPLGVWLQNVGLSDWACGGNVTGYVLRTRWSNPQHAPVDSNQAAIPCGVAQGGSAWAHLNVGNVPDWGYGYYILQFDVIQQTTTGEVRFSPPWPTYNEMVYVLPTSLWGGYTSPANNAAVNYQANLVAQAGGDGNSAGVDRVQFRADVGGTGWKTVAQSDTDCPSGQSCTYNAGWSLASIRNHTTITLGFDIVDKTGATFYSPQGTRTIVVHDDPPTITLQTANGNSSPQIWSNQRQWTFAGTASDPENHLGAITFQCSGDNCGSSVSQTGSGNWSCTQKNLLGQVDIYFTATDPALNVATTRRLDLRIDVAAPATTLTLNGAAPTAWYSGTVQGQLDAADNGSGRATSGVARIVYSLDGGVPQTRSGQQVTFTVSGEGAHAAIFRAFDVLGNAELTRTASFGIDNTAPVALDVAVVTTGSGIGNCAVPTCTVWLDLSASDLGSGVSGARLSNDGESWSGWRGYEKRTLWQLASADAPCPVYFQVRDGAGWVSTPISRTVTYAPPDVWCLYAPLVRRESPGQ